MDRLVRSMTHTDLVKLTTVTEERALEAAEGEIPAPELPDVPAGGNGTHRQSPTHCGWALFHFTLRTSPSPPPAGRGDG